MVAFFGSRSLPSSQPCATLRGPRHNLPNNWGLSHAKTCNKSTRVDGTEITVDATDHEDDDTNDPKGAKEPGCHDTTDTVTNEERAVRRWSASVISENNV